MYQNKYPKMIISIGIYSINRPEAGYGRGGVVYIYIYMCLFFAKNLKSESLGSGQEGLAALQKAQATTSEQLEDPRMVSYKPSEPRV